MTTVKVLHSLSRPIWVSHDADQGWVLVCSCGGWRSEPQGMLKALKAQGLAHLRAGGQLLPG